jgi:NitT/TauT family transport system ATP-binding protein
MGYIDFDDVEQVFPSRSASTDSSPNVITALTGIDLSIEEGQFVALVGASGCGKTTLLNMAAGLLHPTSGTVTIGGRPARSPNLDIGYMFARDALLPWRTAQKNVELPLETRGWPRKKRADRAREMLQLVGLAGRERQFRLQLSQGMRQRVALSRTLAADPPLLLMDEPFAALDARTKLTLQAEFLAIWEEHQGSETNKTVVFVTHDLEEAALLADRVIVMLPHPGRIAKDQLIDLPRPRARDLAEVKFTEQFRETAHGLFESLEGAIATSTT